MRKLWGWVVFIIAIYAGYRWGLRVGLYVEHRLDLRAVPYRPVLLWLAGGLALALPIIGAGKLIAKLIELDLAGVTSVFVRRPVGYLYSFGIHVFAFTATYALLALATIVLAHLHIRVSQDGFANIGGVMLFASLLLAPFTKTPVGKFIVPVRRILRGQSAGRGGSAKFAGLFEEWANPWKPGAVLLGQSIYDPGLKVGITDDRHGLVKAASRGGKGRAVIIPNLLTWPHSALVIDPKGTNAAVTAAKRGNGGYRVKKGMGQTVHVLNPFRVNETYPWMPKGARFNPLSILDPNSLSFYEDLDLIADALVVPSQGENFFDNSARGLLRALTGYAVHIYGKDATLFHVRELLAQVMGKDSPVIEGMIGCGGVIADAAAQIASAEERVKSNIIVTAIQQTDWLGSEAMRETLSHSDFSIIDLKERPTTIYLVLPPEYLETHNRFMRMFVNLAVKAASMDGRSKTPILFLLDEFYSLGPMTSISKAIGNLAGFNIKLFPIVQNLGQLAELYPRNWESFISNAGHFQVFSINDTQSADYISNRLGRAIIYQDDQMGKRIPVGAVDLRDRGEVSREGSRVEGKQIVFREGEDPLILKRINYETAFPKSDFNPDPDQKMSFLHRRWPAIFKS
jgi:type IV secretory pathway TraG/TraD family ATPase VirD4